MHPVVHYSLCISYKILISSVDKHLLYKQSCNVTLVADQLLPVGATDLHQSGGASSPTRHHLALPKHALRHPRRLDHGRSQDVPAGTLRRDTREDCALHRRSAGQVPTNAA